MGETDGGADKEEMEETDRVGETSKRDGLNRNSKNSEEGESRERSCEERVLIICSQFV